MIRVVKLAALVWLVVTVALFAFDMGKAQRDRESVDFNARAMRLQHE